MIFGKTVNHKLVFPKDNKKTKLDQVDTPNVASSKTNETKPLTVKQEIEKNNTKIFDDAIRVMKLEGESKKQRH